MGQGDKKPAFEKVDTESLVGMKVMLSNPTPGLPGDASGLPAPSCVLTTWERLVLEKCLTGRTGTAIGEGDGYYTVQFDGGIGTYQLPQHMFKLIKP